jgi:conjugative transfer pilus assembly protein TraH
MNINSCEIAEQAVSAIYPGTEGARQHICRSMATQDGGLRDIAMARKKCSANNMNIPKENLGDALVGSYNVAWDVIKKDPFLSSHPAFAEFFMSISGTIVIEEEQGPKYYPSKVHDASFMKNLFDGGEVECYLCKVSKPDFSDIFKSTEGCLNIIEGTKSFSGEGSFHQMVNESLKQMEFSVAQNKPLDAQYRAIVGKTSFPIAGVINAMTAHSCGRSPVQLTTFSHVITMDIVCQYLKDVIRNMRSTSLQMRNVQMDSSQIDNFLSSLQDVEKIVLEYEVKGKNVFDEYLRNMQLLEMIDNNLRKKIAL